jgi:N-alpha-acetyltransferase 40
MTESQVEAQINDFNQWDSQKLAHTSRVNTILGEFGALFPDLQADVATSRNISDSDRQACCTLVRTNLKALYEQSSWGWSEERKAEEMNDDAARFILIHGTLAREATLLAFLSFQVVDEEDEAVIYCYEVQLDASIRGRGIGTRMMKLVEAVALDHGLHKSMLTAFVANDAAMQFYKKLGYVTDSTSPQPKLLRGRKVFADYIILSKALH